MNEIPRDRWDRPLIIPPNGEQPVAYTRVSTLAKALDDLSQLMAWSNARPPAWCAAPRPAPRIAGALANGDPRHGTCRQT